MMATDAEEQLPIISLTEAARILGCKDGRTVLAAFRRNGLPIMRVGWVYCVLRTDLERLVEICARFPIGARYGGYASLAKTA
jgi:hypothetical protein